MTSLTAAEVLAHPRFAEARQVHLDAVVRLFRADRFASRMMIDAGMIVLRGFIVGFHMSAVPHDRATWATPGNVRQALVTRGLASARRVDDLLARFQQTAYVRSEPSPVDRRTRILVPTDRLIAHDRDHLAAYHRFLLHLYPGCGYEWILSGDGGVHRAIRQAAVRNQTQALSALQHDALRLFLARDGGYMAFLLVAQAQLSGREGPTWSAMAEDLGVSRTHLRNLFVEAEAAGTVRLEPGRRCPVNLLPSLIGAYDLFLAHVEADQHAIAQAAFAELSVQAGPDR